MAEIISSAENKFVKEVSQLQHAKWRKKLRKFLLEGSAYIADIPSGFHIEYLLVAESRQAEHHDLCQKYMYRIVSDQLMARLCDTVTPQGLIAVGRQPQHNIGELTTLGGLYIICEDVRDPGNLGAIIRTAAAAGATAVLALSGCTESYSPKVLRACAGSIFAIPVAENLQANDIVPLLKKHGTRIYATHLKGTVLPYDIDLRGNCAIIIGNEASGISSKLADMCNAWLKLPMPGAVQSLNASVAAGIIIYESLRQRL